MTTRRRELRLRLQAILDQSAFISADPDLVDKLTDAAIEVMTTVQNPRKPNKGTDYYHLAKAIADVCVMDFESNKDMLMAEARRLSLATPSPTPQLIDQHYGVGGTWYLKNYYGKLGNSPRPSQIRQTWREYVGGVQSSGGKLEVSL